MVKMSKLSTLLLLLLISISSDGQVSMNEAKLNVFGNPFTASNQNYIRMLSMMEDNSAKQMLFEDWTNISVEGKDGKVMQVDSANYSIDVDKVYFIQNAKLYELYEFNVEKIVLGGKMMKVYVDKSKDYDSNFYEVLADGHLDLIKKYTVTIKNMSSNPMGIKTPESQKMVQESKLYYFDNTRKKLEKLPKGKSKLIQIFGRGNNKLIEFANKNNLSPKREKDVVLLFNYYNKFKEESLTN